MNDKTGNPEESDKSTCDADLETLWNTSTGAKECEHIESPVGERPCNHRTYAELGPKRQEVLSRVMTSLAEKPGNRIKVTRLAGNTAFTAVRLWPGCCIATRVWSRKAPDLPYTRALAAYS